MKSKTKISKQATKKQNPELVETILIAKKNPEWIRIAGILSSPRRRKIALNLDQIDKESKEGDILLVPGKVLSQGMINKKIRVVAFAFSESAKEKLLKAKCEVVSILDEVKLNPSARGIKVLE